MPERVAITHFTDPGCPWAYSAIPAHTVLRWRYGEGLDWRLVTIGLTEDAEQYVARGYTPALAALVATRFRRFGMPFLAAVRERMIATSRGCRAIVATRLAHPGREHDALRALQLAWFNTSLLLDEDAALAEALSRVAGIDAPAVVGAIDDPQTLAAYESDRELARSAAGGPTEYQRKARQTDGPVRFSAPSLVFQVDGTRLEAGGFQPLEAYDLAVANLGARPQRREPAEDPLAALHAFPSGLVTQEVAAIMAPNNVAPDRAAAEVALLQLVGEGTARRIPLGDDALWLAA